MLKSLEAFCRPARVVECLAACVLLLAGACSDTPDREPLQDWSRGYDTGGDGFDAAVSDVDAQVDGGPDVGANAFELRAGPDVRWPLHIGQRQDLDKACRVETDGELGFAAGKKIECIVDINELDLWVLGLDLEVSVPEDTCDHLAIQSYMYQNFQLGPIPKLVSFTRADDGTISNEVNSQQGVPRCPWDYSPGGPNCCTGTFTLEVTDAETDKVAKSLGDWGGRPADCYYGAAYLDEKAKFTEDGWPTGRIIYMGRDAHVESAKYKGLSDKYSSNIALANYVDPKDHDDMLPAALRAPYARPLTSFTCLDDAGEIIAHIDMIVREWNEEAEFERARNSNTVGVEDGWDIAWDDIDDVSDWKTQTPGSTDFPNLPHADN